MNFLSTTWKTLTAPTFPPTACSFSSRYFYAAKLGRIHNKKCLVNDSIASLPADLVSPSFESSNLSSSSELANIIKQSLELSGLAKEKKWSIALPEETSRMHIISVEDNIKNYQELEEMIVWKIERIVGIPVKELRITYNHLSPVGKQKRFLIVLALESVIQEYEILFGKYLGWQAGLIWPSSLCGAQWLAYSSNNLPNQLFLNISDNNLTTIVLRNGEPSLIRSQVFSLDEGYIDILYRLLLFYRDRTSEILPGVSLSENPFNQTPFEVMIGAASDSKLILQCIEEVFGVSPMILTPELTKTSHTTFPPNSQLINTSGLALLSNK